MPPWWVHQETGNGVTSVRPFGAFRFCGCSARPRNHYIAEATLMLTLSSACYRTARRGRASFFPELVRFPPFACLSCRSPGRDLSVKGADIGLMSLNGFKLVVTLLASLARIRLRRLVPSRYLRELEYRSPVMMSRGFCTFTVGT